MRRIALLLMGITWLIAAGCDRKPEPVAAPQEPREIVGTIVAVGDSLTAGYGLREEEAYPALLEGKLRAAGYRWQVVNAGISGETSSGTLSRIPWVLKLEPDIVILETGANDGLRGIDPRVTRKNIEETISVLEENGVTVVLAGMKMVTTLGRQFLKEFAVIYPQIAEERGLIFFPFFLDGVAGRRRLNQEDGIHPNAEGYRIITDNLYPLVVEAIRKNGKGRG
ncbi:MAG: arylesterase [Deltaproteobacteria bacterium]|nr:arylesterase [Deltaproteobacteria bacterium]